MYGKNKVLTFKTNFIEENNCFHIEFSNWVKFDPKNFNVGKI